MWGPNSPLAALILWRETTKFVIARRPKADVAILQYPAESWESDRQKRSCLPEIATAPLGPRNDKLGGIAPNNLCRNYCQPVRRSLSAATDAIGAYHFNGTLYRLLVQRRERHAAPLQRTIDGHFRSRDPYF